MYDLSPHRHGGTLSWCAPCHDARNVHAFARISRLSNVPTISIVDDDEDVRVATTKLVRLHGFVAHSFASAEEFLSSPYVRDTSCLISDVRLPGMSGIELQSHLIAQGKHVPVIFITAFPEENSHVRALKAGAAGFLTKPFSGNSLIACLHEALKRPSDDRSN
jgi:FixJ family two-component response regulator